MVQSLQFQVWHAIPGLIFANRELDCRFNVDKYSEWGEGEECVLCDHHLSVPVHEFEEEAQEEGEVAASLREKYQPSLRSDDGVVTK